MKNILKLDNTNRIYPLIMKPEYKDYIWGGKNLVKIGKILPDNGIVAESWEVAAHPDGNSFVSNGPLKGTSLNEILMLLGRDLIGTALPEKDVSTFPLLVKFIDANDKLSVQVHPDDQYAAKSGQYGKNEIWYIIDAEPEAQLIYGLSPNITKEDLIRAIETGNYNKSFKYIKVKPGEVYNIPAGLLHAIGKGIMIAEIQQNSNLTYRVYDYCRTDKAGNRRPLHLKEALDVINFNQSSGGASSPGISINVGDDGSGCSNSDTGDSNSYAGDSANRSSGRGCRCAIRTIYAANRYFALETLEFKDARTQISFNENGSRFKIHTILEGAMEIEWGTTEQGIPCKITAARMGQSLILPAALRKYSLSGKFKSLVSYVPDIQSDIILPLQDAGYDMQEIHKRVSIQI